MKNIKRFLIILTTLIFSIFIISCGKTDNGGTDETLKNLSDEELVTHVITNLKNPYIYSYRY